MKLKKFRNHLDKINCSSDFKIRMEELLSAETDSEYADSVSHVEQARRFNYGRIAAFAASAVIALGIGGGLLLKLDQMPDVTSEGDISSQDDTSILIDNDIPLEPYSIEVSMYDVELEGFTLDLGKIPAEASNRIIEKLKRKRWDEIQDDQSITNTNYLTINCSGMEDFVYTVNADGMAVLEHEGIRSTFQTDNYYYYNIIAIIAQYLPYCDWTSMLGGNLGETIDAAFKSHIEEIETTRDPVDSFDSNIFFFSNGPYSACIDKYGKIRVYYDSGYGVGSNTIEFKSSPELYNEIVKAIDDEYYANATEPTIYTENSVPLNVNETVMSLLDKNLTDTVGYISGTGQVARQTTFHNVDLKELYDVLSSFDWIVADSSMPSGQMFMFGNCMLTQNGELYDQSTGTLFICKAENQDMLRLNNAIDEITRSDDLEYISYLIASSDYRFNTIEGNVNYEYYTVYDNEDSRIIGDGIMMYNNLSKEEYIAFDSSAYNEDYSAEFRMKSGQYAHIQRGDKLKDFIDENVIEVDQYGENKYESCGGMFFDVPVFEYGTMKSKLLSYLNYVGEYPEAVISLSISGDVVRTDSETEYIPFYTVSLAYSNEMSGYIVDFIIDDIGNIIQLKTSYMDVIDDGVYYDFNFKFNNDINGYTYTYDDPDFALPELTEEEKALLDQTEE